MLFYFLFSVWFRFIPFGTYFRISVIRRNCQINFIFLQKTRNYKEDLHRHLLQVTDNFILYVDVHKFTQSVIKLKHFFFCYWICFFFSQLTFQVIIIILFLSSTLTLSLILILTSIKFPVRDKCWCLRARKKQQKMNTGPEEMDVWQKQIHKHNVTHHPLSK